MKEVSCRQAVIASQFASSRLATRTVPTKFIDASTWAEEIRDSEGLRWQEQNANDEGE